MAKEVTELPAKQIDQSETAVEEVLMKHPKRIRNTPSPRLEHGLIAAAIILVASGVGWIGYQKYHYQHLFYPGVTIDNVSIEGKTPDQVKHMLAELDVKTPPRTVTFTSQTEWVSSSSTELDVHRNSDLAIDQAFAVGHQHFVQTGLPLFLAEKPKQNDFRTTWTVNDEKLKGLIGLLKKKVDQPAIQTTAVLGTAGKVATLKIIAGKDGQEIDEASALIAAEQSITNYSGEVNIPVVMASVSGRLTPDQMTVAAERATKLVNKTIVFSATDITKRLNDQKLISLLQFPDGLSKDGITNLAKDWNKAINRPPQDAVLAYDKTTLKVSQFVPPQNGLTIHEDDLQKLLTTSIADLENSNVKTSDVALPVKETPPTVTLGSTNDLGIQQQIGFGESEYFHSIPGRIHNVDLTATRINNSIVEPGAEFSFNKALGDVSAATGFAPAYVIKNGRTELGDGGGVCQVSTTLFRAVLNAGLPVTKRIPHSYRVSYYELNSKPGIDATVYAGEVDFRFKNDTGHSLLIHTENNSKSLYLSIQLYGTSDGRTTQIVDHITSDPVPAPPSLYQDDPSLPRGATKQVDFAASGIKAQFTNIVRDKDGKELRRDTYKSNYKPWQAVFLVGTG